MDRAWVLKTIWKKYLSTDKTYLLARGLTLIIGVWLAVVTYNVNDILPSIVFMGILFVVYILAAICLYRKTRRMIESKIHKQEAKVNVTGIAAIKNGKDGITLMIPKQHK